MRTWEDSWEVLSLGEIRYGDAVSWHSVRVERAGLRGRGQMSSILNMLRLGVFSKLSDANR